MMRRSIVGIIAVAIIGTIGVYTRSRDNSHATAKASSAPVQTTHTTADTAPDSAASSSAGAYKDGTFIGETVDTLYGPVQVAAVISGSKIVDVKFLQMPSDEGHSREVTAFSEAPLKNSALTKQSAQIDFVSGATQTSEGYEQSLQAALDQAA